MIGILLYIPWNHEFAWYGERRAGLDSFWEVQPLSHSSYLKEDRGREGEREKGERCICMRVKERERERERERRGL